MTTSEEVADELGVAADGVLYRRLEQLSSGERVAAVGISIDFTYISSLEGHRSFDEVVKVIARRLAAAAHSDDLVAMHGWDFAVVAERLEDDVDALLAYARELERAVSAEPIDVDGDSVVFTPTVRSGLVGSPWDLRLLLLSPEEEQARQEERRRARLDAHGPQKLDDVVDNPAGPTIDSFGEDDITPFLHLQLAVDLARNAELIDHEMVSREGTPYTIKVAPVNPLIELVKAVDSFLQPLREAKLQEMRRDFLARCPHDRGDDEGSCPECEERWYWHLHEPRGIQLRGSPAAADRREVPDRGSQRPRHLRGILRAASSRT